MLKNQLPFKIKYKIICVKFFIKHPYMFLENLIQKNNLKKSENIGISDAVNLLKDKLE